MPPETTTSTQNPYIQVTRCYTKNKGEDNEEVMFQPKIISRDSIEGFRPNNTIGTKDNGNRSIIDLKSRRSVKVKEKFSELKRLVGHA